MFIEVEGPYNNIVAENDEFFVALPLQIITTTAKLYKRFHDKLFTNNTLKTCLTDTFVDLYHTRLNVRHNPMLGCTGCGYNIFHTTISEFAVPQSRQITVNFFKGCFCKPQCSRRRHFKLLIQYRT